MVPHNRNTNTFVVMGNIKRCPSKGQQYSRRRISFLVKKFFNFFNLGGGCVGRGSRDSGVCVCAGVGVGGWGGIVVCFKAC